MAKISRHRPADFSGFVRPVTEEPIPFMTWFRMCGTEHLVFPDCDQFAGSAAMRHAINSSNIIGNSANIRSARAIAAAHDVHMAMHRKGKRLSKVGGSSVCEGSVSSPVSVRVPLCERLATSSTTIWQPKTQWQNASYPLPAAAWAAFVLNPMTSL